MHAAAFSPRGGVAPKTTRLRGQSIIEYVLIIALIGLVIVFAGPGVAGAIRNQFNLVGARSIAGRTAVPRAVRRAAVPQAPVPRPCRRPSPRTRWTGRSMSRRP